MERLRIRLPPLNYVCIVETCSGKTSNLLCLKCLHTRVRQEMPPATLAHKSEIRHRATLRGDLSC
jgi:hypothetical protein